MQENNMFVTREEFTSFFNQHMKFVKISNNHYHDAKDARDLLYDVITKQRVILTSKLHDLASKTVVEELKKEKEKSKKLRKQLKDLKTLLINKGKA